MMYNSNLIFLVLSSQRQKVFIWDDIQQKMIGEALYRTVVKNVKLWKSIFIVILENKIWMHDISTLNVIKQVETGSNPLGLCGLSTAEKPIS